MQVGLGQLNNGTSGPELLQWNQPSVQRDLSTMVQRFLENEGNADRFWSPARSWNQGSKVEEYPKDRARIIELLKQLFWKQNRYAANNILYGYKSIDDRDGSRDKSTPMHQNVSTERNMSGTTPSNSDIQTSYQAREGLALAPDQSPFSGLEPEMTQENGNVTDFRATHDQDELRPCVEKDNDIFEVPDDESVLVSGTVPRSPALSLKHARSGQSTISRNLPSRKRKEINIPRSPVRRTKRKTIPRERPGIVPCVSDAIYEDILKTPSISEERHLRPDSYEERPQHFSKEDIHTLRSPIESTTKSFQSPTSTSNKPYTAPTAQMVVANEMHDVTSASIGTSQPTEGISSEPRSDASSLRVRLSKIVRLSTAGMNKPQPRLPERSTPVLVQAAAAGQGDQNTAAAPNSTPGDSHIEGLPSPEYTRPVSEPQQRQSPSARDSVNSTAAVDLPSDQQPILAQSPGIEAKDSKNHGSNPLKVDHGDHGKRSSSAENPSSKPRAKTQVPLWIITRQPRYTEERWDDGQFQGTLLSEFIGGVSDITQRDDIEKLKLTLETPTFDTKVTIFRNVEDSWLSAKETFAAKLKGAKIEARTRHPTEPASFKILVEPFYEQKALMASNIEEDDEEVFLVYAFREGRTCASTIRTVFRF